MYFNLNIFLLPPIFRFIKRDRKKNEDSYIKFSCSLQKSHVELQSKILLYQGTFWNRYLFKNEQHKCFFDFTSVYYAHFCFSRNSINRLLTVANWFLKIFPRLRHTVVSLSISGSKRYFAHFSFQKSQLIHCTTVEWQFLFAFFLNLRHTVVSLSISRSRRGYVPHHHCPSSMTGNWYIVAPKETIKELQRSTL